MSDDVNDKKHASAVMSPSAPRPRALDLETEYLRAQADDAHEAIADTLARMRHSVAQAGDLRTWARDYPWPTVGAAATLGFLAVAALGSRSDRRPPESLLAKILSDEQIATRVRELSESQDAPGQPPVMASVASMLWKLFGGALESAVLAAMTPQGPGGPSPSGQGASPAGASSSGDESEI